MLPLHTRLGKLQIIEVLIDYDGPQLFSCMSDDGRVWIATHAADDSESDLWLYARTTQSRLREIVRGRISLHTAFISPSWNILELVRFDANQRAQVERVQPESVPEDWLPLPGEYLNLEQDSSEALRIFDNNNRISLTPSSVAPLQGLEQLSSRLLNYNYAPSNYRYAPSRIDLPDFLLKPSPMWEMSPAALEYLKSIRTPTSVAATQSGKFVVDLMLEGDARGTQVPVDGLAKVLSSLQMVVNSFTDSAASGEERSSARYFREDTQMNALAVFPSSFGLRVESGVPALFANPALLNALSRIVDLLSKARETDSIADILRLTGTRSALRFKAFIKALSQSPGNVRVEVGTPGQMESRKADLTKATLQALARFLDEEVQRSEESLMFTGRLIAISLKTKFFMLENEETSVSGRIAETAMTSIRGRVIGADYIAELLLVTELNEGTGAEIERYILTSLAPL